MIHANDRSPSYTGASHQNRNTCLGARSRSSNQPKHVCGLPSLTRSCRCPHPPQPQHPHPQQHFPSHPQRPPSQCHFHSRRHRLPRPPRQRSSRSSRHPAPPPSSSAAPAQSSAHHRPSSSPLAARHPFHCLLYGRRAFSRPLYAAATSSWSCSCAARARTDPIPPVRLRLGPAAALRDSRCVGCARARRGRQCGRTGFEAGQVPRDRLPGDRGLHQRLRGRLRMQR